MLSLTGKAITHRTWHLLSSHCFPMVTSTRELDILNFHCLSFQQDYESLRGPSCVYGGILMFP